MSSETARRGAGNRHGVALFIAPRCRPIHTALRQTIVDETPVLVLLLTIFLPTFAERHRLCLVVREYKVSTNILSRKFYE